MSGQWIFIRAVDVWMFRDNKPFSAGQNFVARSMFPPHPQVIYGALRSHILERAGVDWNAYARGEIESELAGTTERYGSLRILGMSIGRELLDGRVEPVYTAPLDLVKTGDAHWDSMKPTGPHFETNAVDNWMPLDNGGGEQPNLNWLHHDQMQAYLGSRAIKGEALKPEDIFEAESRVGLGLDYRRRANAESLFYRAEFVRPADDIGLLLHLNAEVFEGREIMNIGGESRSAVVEVVEAPSMLPHSASGRLKLVLLTPAYFRSGWEPEAGDWSRWVGSGRLVSAAVSKPVAISGWDVARNRPKPLRHYVPAGSVYYFENATWNPAPLTETVDEDNDLAAAGYGLCAVGTWGN